MRKQRSANKFHVKSSSIERQIPGEVLRNICIIISCANTTEQTVRAAGGTDQTDD